MTARERLDRAAELRNIAQPIAVAVADLQETLARLVRFADELAKDDDDKREVRR